MKYSSKEQAYVIVLSSQYAEYFNKTISINYNKRFDELIGIRGKGSAFIRSIIEFFITHDASADNIQRMKLMQLLLLLLIITLIVVLHFGIQKQIVGIL